MDLLDQGASPDNAGKNDELEAYAPGLGSASTPSPTGGGNGGSSGDDPGGLRVSLMLSDSDGRSGPDLGRGILILVLVLVMETLAIGTGYFFLIRRESGLESDRVRLETELQQLQTEIEDAETAAKEVVAFTTQTKAVAQALDDHVYWSGLFAFLEQRTRTSVSYLNFVGDSNSGVITMDAVGRSYRDVAEQIVQLREDPMVQELRTTSAAARVSEVGEVVGVTFSMVMRLDPAVWEKTDFSAVPSAPVTGTAPSATTETGAPSPPADRSAGSSPEPVTGRSIVPAPAPEPEPDDGGGADEQPVEPVSPFPDPGEIDLE